MTKVKISLPFIMHFQLLTYTDDKAISNAFNKYFQSVFIESTNFILKSEDEINFSPIKLIEFKKALNKFSNNSSPGPGGVPVYFLKKFDESTYKIITIIFNQFIKYNYYPPQWKTAIVTPLYKSSGEVNDLKSYRPISVTNVFSRIFERIMTNRLKEYLNSINFFLNTNMVFKLIKTL